MPRVTSVSALLLAFVVAHGCAARTGRPAEGSTQRSDGSNGETQGARPVQTAADAAAIARAQADSARLPYTAADVRFVQGMIGHHAQAIVMSKMAPTHGASAEIQRLAERIINAQQDEIALMQTWLRDRRQAVPTPATEPMHHAGMDAPGDVHAMHMPGMLTEAQLARLGAARGLAFDELFLTYMIQHHKGAVDMVKELLASPGAAQDRSVFKLAADINVDQVTEIDRMERMLYALKLAKISR